MGGRGKAVRNAGISGRHEITNSTPRIPSIGPDIEAWAGDHETQITSTKNAREEAFLDTLVLPAGSRTCTYVLPMIGEVSANYCIGSTVKPYWAKSRSKLKARRMAKRSITVKLRASAKEKSLSVY